ncbi:YjbA family protein [Gottfriedia acidiceleris]|uniref:YjbA family protein n=1 Tax=Gottfriedia acidiceleris TaxID=371036 RepID=UPI00101DB791|nr:YjbA family protein [Gottfriedia acidiceleris]
MLYLHDVWVNWFEGEENGYNVCHFFEWRKDDSVELLDQVPVIKVTPELYQYIENELLELPSGLLTEVFQKSYVRKNHERIQLDYCFVVTDGNGIIAVDTIGYNIPIRKSRLIPRQEQMVYDMTAEIEESHYNLQNSVNDETKEHHILSPSPIIMSGLTRKERQLKQLLFMALDQLHSSKNPSEIRYWYTEWNPRSYQQIQDLSFEDIWSQLYDEIKSGWSERHEQLCGRIVKGQPFFEKLWEMEHEQKVN